MPYALPLGLLLLYSHDFDIMNLFKRKLSPFFFSAVLFEEFVYVLVLVEAVFDAHFVNTSNIFVSVHGVLFEVVFVCVLKIFRTAACKRLLVCMLLVSSFGTRAVFSSGLLDF